MERRTMGRKIYFEMFGGRFLLRAYIPSLRRSFSKRSRSKITSLYIYIFSLPSRIFFRRSHYYSRRERTGFFARSHDDRKKFVYAPDMAKIQAKQRVFGNRRKLSIDPPFESVDSHACVSQCSFHPRDDCLSASLRLLV